MITCFIRFHIDPTKKEQFAQYARNWGQAIPRCGADLIGYYAPHEGSSTLAYVSIILRVWRRMKNTGRAYLPTHLVEKIMNLRSERSFWFERTGRF